MIDRFDQTRLTRYLLGLLPEEDSGRLDELSVTDDEFAAELNAAENDLVDAYARGELPSDLAARFEDVYSSSERRRQKLMLAQTFVSYFEKAQRATTDSAPVAASKARKKRWWAWSSPQWGFAAAAAVLLFVSGYLGLTNHTLRQRLNESEVARTELEKQESARTATHNSTATDAVPAIPTDHLRVASFIFLPPVRGLGTLPRVTVPAGIDLVVLKLELESNEFSAYRVTLQDAATRSTVWSSRDLKPLKEQNGEAVSFALKPSLLESKNYILELNGVRNNGQTELVSTYPFKSTVD